MAPPVALIIGVTGQDGSYLAELLLEQGYNVFGVIRRSSSFNTDRIDHIYRDPHENSRLRLVYGDLNDASSLNKVLREVQPREIYNLGAQSHVRVSFDIPEYTAEVVGLGTLRLLEAMRQTCPDARFYQASSSEMFGSSPPPQRETTPFHPRSPYACAKVFAFNTAVNYREAYKLHISNGILFNHTSPRRGGTFVTKKIVAAAAKIARGKQEALFLGNLDARRDWGHARDYVEAMYMMLQQEEPDDYVIASGKMHSVRDVLDMAFGYYGLDWSLYVKKDPKYLRPAEVDELCGDATKAQEKLGWSPRTGMQQIIWEMCDAAEKE